mmetsp:Transcript_101326/g.261847  ORF Transcript_101326/g.261847 Transcript_101326/m.261847 type:complete len:226 (-) Transcript_101326:852-1529(-)
MVVTSSSGTYSSSSFASAAGCELDPKMPPSGDADADPNKPPELAADEPNKPPVAGAKRPPVDALLDPNKLLPDDDPPKRPPVDVALVPAELPELADEEEKENKEPADGAPSEDWVNREAPAKGLAGGADAVPLVLPSATAASASSEFLRSWLRAFKSEKPSTFEFVTLAWSKASLNFSANSELPNFRANWSTDGSSSAKSCAVQTQHFSLPALGRRSQYGGTSTT